MRSSPGERGGKPGSLVTSVTPATVAGREAVGVMRTDAPELALPQLDVRGLARRAALPAGLVAVAAGGGLRRGRRRRPPRAAFPPPCPPRRGGGGAAPGPPLPPPRPLGGVWVVGRR